MRSGSIPVSLAPGKADSPTVEALREAVAAWASVTAVVPFGGLTRTARHLQVTPTMVDDFLIDPCLGAYVIFGIKLDVFQMVRQRLYWWTPDMIDSSGLGTGKSLGFFLFMNLRCALIGLLARKELPDNVEATPLPLAYRLKDGLPMPSLTEPSDHLPVITDFFLKR